MSRRLLVLILCWSLVHPVAPVLWAQSASRTLTLPLPGLQKKISLDLRQMDVLEVMKFLAQQGDLNIVPTKNVGGRVTLQLNDVRIQDALDLIMIINELAYAQEGKIIQVMTEGEYQRLYGDPFADRRVVQQLQIRYANMADVAAILGNIKSGVGKIIADASTGTLILIDVQEKLNQMVTTVFSLERVAQTQDTHVFELKYGKADAVKPEVEKVLSPKTGTVRMDKRTNTLIVTDLPQRMQEVRKVIMAFDRKTREVTIETKIINVRLTDAFRVGVNWETIFKDVSGLDVVGSFPISPATNQGAKVTIGTLAQDKFTGVVQFLQTLGTTDILSTPQISVIENEEAKILVGRREAFVTSVVTQTAQASTTAEQLTFIDVGIQLRVTASINQDGFVTMKIRPEVSSVAEKITTSLGNVVPIVETSTAESTVMVRSGHTIVIAGLIRDEKVKTERKVPILGSIPLIGALFRARQEDTVRAELIFFLTPKVIEGLEDAASGQAASTAAAVPASLRPSPSAPMGVPEVQIEAPGKATAAPVPSKASGEKAPVLDVLKRLDKVLSSMREIVGQSATHRKGDE